MSLVESTVRTKRGETIPVRMNVAALSDEKGELIGGVESFQDISALKTLERERNNLISTFAHDMKSSLTIIGGFVLRLLHESENLDGQKDQRYLEIIRDESGKLEMLISDFLEFARLQTGRLKLNLSATTLDKELIGLSEAYQPRFPAQVSPWISKTKTSCLPFKGMKDNCEECSQIFWTMPLNFPKGAGASLFPQRVMERRFVCRSKIEEWALLRKNFRTFSMPFIEAESAQK